MIDTKLDYGKTLQVLIDKTADYLILNGLKSAVIGISGGIDSTLVSYILRKAADRLEANIKGDDPDFKFNVIGISMPSSTTNDNEFEAAKVVGNTFCNIFHIMSGNDFTIITGNIFKSASSYFKSKTEIEDKFRIGNIKSRLRTVYLYDYARTNKGLVVGTDNFTEKLLGFSTIGGDGLFDYCPIQNLWKTEVFELSKYIISESLRTNDYKTISAFSKALSVPPQDGLGISSTDMDQIGAKDYYEVDEILYCLYKNGFNESIVYNQIKLDAKVIKSVIDRVNNNKYKSNLPVVISPNDFVYNQ